MTSESTAPVSPSGRFERSSAAFDEALRYIPGGVNSPVRAFGAVGGKPLFFTRGAGSRLTDLDGNEFIDYVGSWGPMILGHADPDVVRAVEGAVRNGFSFGTPTEMETVLARMIVEAVPSIEKVRMVNSGTEATMSAIRLARGFTRRDQIVKFEGCYHGHVDALLVAAGSGLATLGTPTSPGIPKGVTDQTFVLPYNDIPALEELFTRRGESIAAVIVEPIAGNMGVVPPVEGFLQRLRDLTEEYSALLIFDEVMSGFRVAKGGAQERYRITPDMTTLGKVIGGGFPVGAYGASAEIMDHISPVGDVYQAGTLSGNPVAMTAGIATLEKLFAPGTYERLEITAKHLAAGLKQVIQEVGLAACHTGVGAMQCLFFSEGPIRNFQDAEKTNSARFEKYFHGMLQRGIYIAPSAYEATFVSTAHTDDDIVQTLDAVRASLKEVR